MLATSLVALAFWVSPLAAASEPDVPRIEDLEAALALFEIGGGRVGSLYEDPDKSFEYFMVLSGSWLGTSGEPETLLRPDPDTGLWRIDDIYRPRPSRSYLAGSLSAEFEYRPAPWVELSLFLDTREVRAGSSFDPPRDGVRFDGLTLGDFVREGGPVRGASIGVGSGNVRGRAGRYRVAIGSGLVFDEFATGAGVSADWDRMVGAPLTTGADFVFVSHAFGDLDRASPLLALSGEWLPAAALGLRPFAALYWERNGEVANVVRSTVVERIARRSAPDRATQILLDGLYEGSGTATLAYFGTELEWQLAPQWTLGSRAAAALGRVTLGRLHRIVDAEVFGGALELELDYSLHRYVSLSALGLFMSGDEPPISGRYHGFLAVRPYWTWTGLFFAGGLTQGFYPEGAAAGGVNGHGVLGAGPSLVIGGARANTELSVLGLRAVAPPPPAPLGGRNLLYGVEIDWRARFSPWDPLSLGVELDVLVPGGYFYETRTAYRGLVLGALSYGN